MLLPGLIYRLLTLLAITIITTLSCIGSLIAVDMVNYVYNHQNVWSSGR